MVRFFRFVPAIAGAVCALVLFFSADANSAVGLLQRPVLAVCFLLLAAVFIAFSARLLRPQRVPSARHFFSAPLGAFFSGAVFLLLVDSSIARFFVALGIGVSVWAFLSRTRLAKDDGEHDSAVVESAVVLLALAAFFLMAVLFGLRGFIELSAIALAVFAGLGIVALTAEAVLLTPLLPRARLLLMAVFGLLFAQCFAVLSFFPTSFLVSAAVLALLFSLGLHVVRRAALSTASTSLGRETLLSLLLIFSILLTAQWV